MTTSNCRGWQSGAIHLHDISRVEGLGGRWRLGDQLLFAVLVDVVRSGRPRWWPRHGSEAQRPIFRHAATNSRTWYISPAAGLGDIWRRLRGQLFIDVLIIISKGDPQRRPRQGGGAWQRQSRRRHSGEGRRSRSSRVEKLDRCECGHRSLQQLHGSSNTRNNASQRCGRQPSRR
jgi:hypothetical protein